MNYKAEENSRFFERGGSYKGAEQCGNYGKCAHYYLEYEKYTEKECAESCFCGVIFGYAVVDKESACRRKRNGNKPGNVCNDEYRIEYACK